MAVAVTGKRPMTRKWLSGTTFGLLGLAWDISLLFLSSSPYLRPTGEAALLSLVDIASSSVWYSANLIVSCTPLKKQSLTRISFSRSAHFSFLLASMIFHPGVCDYRTSLTQVRSLYARYLQSRLSKFFSSPRETLIMTPSVSQALSLPYAASLRRDKKEHCLACCPD